MNNEVSEVVLTFESVDEILRCDNSNEASSVVLLHGKMWILCFGSKRVGFLSHTHCSKPSKLQSYFNF